MRQGKEPGQSVVELTFLRSCSAPLKTSTFATTVACAALLVTRDQ